MQNSFSNFLEYLGGIVSKLGLVVEKLFLRLSKQALIIIVIASSQRSQQSSTIYFSLKPFFLSTFFLHLSLYEISCSVFLAQAIYV